MTTNTNKTLGQVAFERAGSAFEWDQLAGSPYDCREWYEHIASAVEAAVLARLVPVGYQMRRYWSDPDDPGWSDWSEVRGDDVPYYQKKATKERGRCEVRTIYALPKAPTT